MSENIDSNGGEHQQWWLSNQGKPTGPHGKAYVLAGLKTGAISPQTYACPVDGQDWKLLPEWPDFEMIKSPPLPPPPPPIALSSVNVARQTADSPFTNPSLPRMANWICIYTIVISPINWFISNFSCIATGSIFEQESDAAGIEAITWLFGFFVSLAIVAVLMIGGLKLRALRSSGTTWLKVGLWIDIVSPIVAIFVIIPISMLNQEYIREPTTVENLISFIFMTVGFTCFLFEIFALVWLYRNESILGLQEEPPAAPWNPTTIVLFGLVFSQVWTGMMAAINGRFLKLGLPIWRPIAIAVGFPVVCFCLRLMGIQNPFSFVASYLGALWLLWNYDLDPQVASFEQQKSLKTPSKYKWLAPILFGIPIAIMVLLVFLIIPIAQSVYSGPPSTPIASNLGSYATDETMWERIKKEPIQNLKFAIFGIVALCYAIGYAQKAWERFQLKGNNPNVSKTQIEEVAQSEFPTT